MKVEILTRAEIEQFVQREITKQMRGLCAQVVQQLKKHNTSIAGVSLSDSDSISLLEPSVRLEGVLRDAGLDTVGKLAGVYPSELMKYRKFGKVCLSELQVRLAFHGRQLK